MVRNEDQLLTSVSDVVSYVTKNVTGHGTILFRGQSDAEWPLLPSIAVEGNAKHQREPLYEKDKEKGTASLLLAEERMIRQLKRRSHPFLDMRPDSDWDWLAIAQHYGIPTRLLDWSINSLAALWFTVEKPPKKKPVPSQSGNSTGSQNKSTSTVGRVKWKQDPKFAAYRPGSFWVYQPKEGPLGDPGEFISTKSQDPGPFSKNCPAGVFVPSTIAPRIAAQRGYFTVHPPKSRSEPVFTPLEEDQRFKGTLTKFIIPPESFRTIRRDLVRLGVTPMTIFPELESLCKEARWWHIKLFDEDL